MTTKRLWLWKICMFDEKTVRQVFRAQKVCLYSSIQNFEKMPIFQVAAPLYLLFQAQFEMNDPENTPKNIFSTKRYLYCVFQVSNILCSKCQGFLTSKRYSFCEFYDNLSKRTFINLENFGGKMEIWKINFEKKLIF